MLAKKNYKCLFYVQRNFDRFNHIQQTAGAAVGRGGRGTLGAKKKEMSTLQTTVDKK